MGFAQVFVSWNAQAWLFSDAQAAVWPFLGCRRNYWCSQYKERSTFRWFLWPHCLQPNYYARCNITVTRPDLSSKIKEPIKSKSNVVAEHCHFQDQWGTSSTTIANSYLAALYLHFGRVSMNDVNLGTSFLTLYEYQSTWTQAAYEAIHTVPSSVRS